MPKVKQELSVDSLRHTEYYGMQRTYDDLYAKSKNGEQFPTLMDIILSRENILLAYRNIKANTGSNTPRNRPPDHKRYWKFADGRSCR